MFTRVGFHFLTLIRVAGETDSLHLINCGKIHLQRIVGMVTGFAFLKTIMNRVLGAVALITPWNRIFSEGGVFGVTFETTDLLVQPSSLVDLLRGILMTLAAVLLD